MSKARAKNVGNRVRFYTTELANSLLKWDLSISPSRDSGGEDVQAGKHKCSPLKGIDQLLEIIRPIARVRGNTKVAGGTYLVQVRNQPFRFGLP